MRRERKNKRDSKTPMIGGFVRPRYRSERLARSGSSCSKRSCAARNELPDGSKERNAEHHQNSDRIGNLVRRVGDFKSEQASEQEQKRYDVGNICWCHF